MHMALTQLNLNTFVTLSTDRGKSVGGKYYESKIQHLKGENPKRWWDETKRLCGLKTSHSDLAGQIKIELILRTAFQRASQKPSMSLS